MEAYKVCPLAFAYNPATLRKCVKDKCAWSIGGECAFVAIFNRLEAIRQEIVKPLRKS